MYNPYIDVIGYFYPNVSCHASAETYNDIVWDGGDTLPDEATLTPLLLEYKRLIKWEEIKKYRDDRLEHGGYPTPSGWFHSDALARDNYEDANKPNTRAYLAYLEQQATPKMWKTMSGSWVALTVTLLDTLLANKVTQKNDHFYSAEVLKVGLWLANDPDNYDYFQNAEKSKWPIIYGE